MTTGFYLLDHKPYKPSKRGRPQRWYPRADPNGIDLIVLHTAENATDDDGHDTGASRVARYFATGGRDVSIHCCVDSQNTIRCLPDRMVAWHVAGYNARSLGVEFCMSEEDWSKVSPAYMRGIIEHGAEWVAQKCYEHDIPVVLLSKADVDRGERGISYHRFLSDRRDDPGKGFPEKRFFEAVRLKVQRISNPQVTSLSPLEDRGHDDDDSPGAPDASQGWWEQDQQYLQAVALGVTDGERATEPATRAEAAVMAMRAARATMKLLAE